MAKPVKGWAVCLWDERGKDPVLKTVFRARQRAEKLARTLRQELQRRAWEANVAVLPALVQPGDLWRH